MSVIDFCLGIRFPLANRSLVLSDSALENATRDDNMQRQHESKPLGPPKIIDCAILSHFKKAE